ncbi:MAG: xanthine dehydrogenase family protein molybdopterin-binding subunit, partial [Burkholderiales bacterium]
MDRAPSNVARVGAVGVGTPRAQAKRLAAGRGRYTDDLRFGRVLHAAFLRSPYAHARLLGLDLAAARATEGVVAVFDGATIATICKPWETRLATWPQHRSAPQPALAIDKVLWQGQPIAIVLATSRAIAEDAAAKIDASYVELEPVVDAEGALALGAPLIHPELGSNLALEHSVATGDPAAAFARAAKVVTRKLRFARHTGIPLEARTIVAEFDPTVRRLTVHQSTQVPHQMRAVFADQLGLPEQDVRVITPDIGGGFGIKLHVYDDEMAVCAAAMLVGRPVKYVCDRLESLSSDVHARAHTVDAKIALTADGAILAFAIDTLTETGAYSVYPRSSILEGLQAINFAGLPYAHDAYSARLRVAYQNKIGTASYRGVGQPVGTGVVEALVDAAARELAIDPAEIRRRNFRREGQGPTGVDASGLSHEACLDRLLALMDYPALRVEQAKARAAGRHLGIGLSAFVEQNAPGPAFYGAADVKISAQDGCTLRLEPSGTITCITSNADQGQGVETALAQLVAEAMGVPLDAVRIAGGDTVMTSVGGGTFASRGLAISGEAALAAAKQLRERLDAINAALGGPPRSLAELGAVLHYKQHLLPPGIAAEPMVTAHITMKRPFLLANGVQASLVELDPDTGFVKLRKHWIVEDCGRVINPLLADAQLRGGIIQGIGAAMWEECRYDERGQTLAGTMADYLVPMSRETPDIAIEHIETSVTDTLLGATGIGEAGTIGAAAAVANAINDAL